MYCTPNRWGTQKLLPSHSNSERMFTMQKPWFWTSVARPISPLQEKLDVRSIIRYCINARAGYSWSKPIIPSEYGETLYLTCDHFVGGHFSYTKGIRLPANPVSYGIPRFSCSMRTTNLALTSLRRSENAGRSPGPWFQNTTARIFSIRQFLRYGKHQCC